MTAIALGLAAAAPAAAAPAPEPERAAVHLVDPAGDPGGQWLAVGSHRYACGDPAAPPAGDGKPCRADAPALMILLRPHDDGSARLAALAAAHARLGRLELRTWASWNRGGFEVLSDAEVVRVETLADGDRVVIRYGDMVDVGLWSDERRPPTISAVPVPVQILAPCAPRAASCPRL